MPLKKLPLTDRQPSQRGFTVHPTAIVEKNVSIGPETSVWDNVHIRHHAKIGSECIIGEKSYIAYSVRIGNRVKINSHVYICAGVTIEDGVMVSAAVVFTNDKYPRALALDFKSLASSAPDEKTLETFVRRGATIGANATIGPGIEIGEFAMIGMGAVVTKDIPPFTLAVGNPAKPIGYVCRCGERLVFRAAQKQIQCTKCDSSYQNSHKLLTLSS